MATSTSPAWKKRVLLITLALLATYVIVEAVASSVAWSRWWGTSFFVSEDYGRAVQFDAVRGYRLTSTPTRYARITNGVIEFVGVIRGNNRGFSDRDDFTPKRTTPGTRRFAVFGDSFTAAQFLGQNWPDRAEDLLLLRGEKVELLNFAVEEGLANWWSVLTRHVEADGYELDGVIFALWGDNLRRTYYYRVAPDAAHPALRSGRLSDWDPATYPKDLADAERHLKVMTDAYSLPPEEFERLLQGRANPPAGRTLRPYFLSKAWGIGQQLLGRFLPRNAEPKPPVPAHESHREAMIGDIVRFLASHKLPALVVHLPSIEELTRGGAGGRDAAEFAKAIGATYLDGSQAFRGLGRGEIAAQFFPYDPRWNQAGSNRFARFMADELTGWASAKPDPAASVTAAK